MKSREEHLEWCKARAREYLDQRDIMNAVTSMLSDLEKHPETSIKGESGAYLYWLGVLAVNSGDVGEARRFIEGFR